MPVKYVRGPVSNAIQIRIGELTKSLESSLLDWWNIECAMHQKSIEGQPGNPDDHAMGNIPPKPDYHNVNEVQRAVVL